MLIGKKEAYSFVHGVCVNLVLNKVLELAVQLEHEVGPGVDRWGEDLSLEGQHR